MIADYTESQNYTQTYYRRAGRTVAHHDRYMRRMHYRRARFLTALADSHEAARVWGLEPVVEERAPFGAPTILGSKHRLQAMMNADDSNTCYMHCGQRAMNPQGCDLSS